MTSGSVPSRRSFYTKIKKAHRVFMVSHHDDDDDNDGTAFTCICLCFCPGIIALSHLPFAARALSFDNTRIELPVKKKEIFMEKGFGTL